VLITSAAVKPTRRLSLTAQAAALTPHPIQSPCDRQRAAFCPDVVKSGIADTTGPRDRQSAQIGEGVLVLLECVGVGVSVSERGLYVHAVRDVTPQ
jgi:hypothetical protein